MLGPPDLPRVLRVGTQSTEPQLGKVLVRTPVRADGRGRVFGVGRQPVAVPACVPVRCHAVESVLPVDGRHACRLQARQLGLHHGLAPPVGVEDELAALCWEAVAACVLRTNVADCVQPVRERVAVGRARFAFRRHGTRGTPGNARHSHTLPHTRARVLVCLCACVHGQPSASCKSHKSDKWQPQPDWTRLEVRQITCPSRASYWHKRRNARAHARPRACAPCRSTLRRRPRASNT